MKTFGTGICENISNALSDPCKQEIDRMFISRGLEEIAPFSFLKDDPGKPALNSVFVELDKLNALNGLRLSDNVLADVSDKTVQQ